MFEWKCWTGSPPIATRSVSIRVHTSCICAKTMRRLQDKPVARLEDRIGIWVNILIWNMFYLLGLSINHQTGAGVMEAVALSIIRNPKVGFGVANYKKYCKKWPEYRSNLYFKVSAALERYLSSYPGRTSGRGDVRAGRNAFGAGQITQKRCKRWTICVNEEPIGTHGRAIKWAHPRPPTSPSPQTGGSKCPPLKLQPNEWNRMSSSYSPPHVPQT